MVLPDFIICGAIKGGTTTLSAYLRQHPEVFMIPREVHFFSIKYSFGLKWYESRFQGYTNQKIFGEKSPEYMLSKAISKRIFNNLPNIKLIFILRNPVERAYSHYWMAISDGRIKIPSFRNFLLNKENFYLKCGLYAQQLKPFLDQFPRDNILILLSEEFRYNTKEVLKRVLKFIGVTNIPFQYKKRNIRGGARRSYYISILVRYIDKTRDKIPIRFIYKILSKLMVNINRFNKKKRYPPMKDFIRKRLEEFYRESNKELKELIDLDIDKWWK